MAVEAVQKQKNILSFVDLIPGIVSNLWRLPSIISAIKSTLNLKDEDRDSLGSYLEKNAARYPHKNAILFEDVVYTHQQFNQAVNRYANFFIKQGLQRGDVAVVLVENRPELLMVIGALSKLGVIASLINTNQRRKVLIHSINLDPGKTIIVGEELTDAFDEVRPELGLSDETQVFFLEDSGKKSSGDGYRDLTQQIAESPDSNPATTGQIMLKDRYANVFTSGTTGLPKASIQTHRRWITCLNWFGAVNLNLKTDDVMYVSIPFFHTNALSVAWPCAAVSGAALAIRRRFSVSNFWKDIRKFDATAFIYIGEICRYLINQEPSADDKKNRVSKIVGNGLRPEIWKEFTTRFGISKVFELYGAADGTAGFTNTFNIEGSVGWCASKFAIVEYDMEAEQPFRDGDNFMQKVDRGKSGLCIAELSESMPFAGYTNKSANEKRILRDVFEKGDIWFDTGDILRDIGFKHAQFVDRLGDTFRWKGENVSTGEVEEIVNISHAFISGSTVYGVPIPGTDGKAGMAAILADIKPDEFDFVKMVTALRKDLPSYAIPIFIRFITEFDTTATHKIKKHELRTEGIDLEKVKSPIYVLLPGADTYVPLTETIHTEILDNQYRF